MAVSRAECRIIERSFCRSRARLRPTRTPPVCLSLNVDARLAAAPVIDVGRPSAVLERRIDLGPVGCAAGPQLAVPVRVDRPAYPAAAAVVGVAGGAVVGRHSGSLRRAPRRPPTSGGVCDEGEAEPCLRRLDSGAWRRHERDGKMT